MAKQKLTYNQQQWKNELAKVRRNLTRLKNQGYYIPDFDNLYNQTMPKRVTKNEIKKIKALEFSTLQFKAFEIDKYTGEAESVAAAKRRRRDIAKQQKKEQRTIIKNAKSRFESYLGIDNDKTLKVKRAIDEKVKREGLEKTAKDLQHIANVGDFVYNASLDSPPFEAVIDNLINDDFNISEGDLSKSLEAAGVGEALAASIVNDYNTGSVIYK